MQKFEPQPVLAEDERLVFVAEIVKDLSLTQRGLRKWILAGKFPQPDGNLYGRNFWQLATYRQWKNGALAGKYSRQTALCSKPSADQPNH